MTTEYRFDQIAIVSTEKRKPTENDKHNYIGLEHLSPDTFEVENYGSEVAPKGEKLVMRKGDVLFGKRRAYQKKVGIAPCDGIFSAHGMVLRPNEEIVDSRFFPFFIKSDAFLDEAIRISVGSLSPTVNWRDLRELRFHLPLLDRQRELAELLWAGEDLKTTYRKLLATCDEQVKSRFIEMFGTASEPKYDVVHVDQLCSAIVDCPHETPKYEGKLIHPAIRTSELPGTHIAWETMKYVSEEEYAQRIRRLKPMPGDVVYAREGTYGTAAVLPEGFEFCLGQRTMLFRPDETKCTSEFLLHAITSVDVRRQADELNVGATVPHVNVKDAKKFSMPFPPICEQEAFTAFVQQVDKSEYCCRNLALKMPALRVSNPKGSTTSN